MNRYIDVDIAKNLILNDMALAEREGKDLNGYTDALFHLKTIPTADVVEVVRCKDCIFYEGNCCFNPQWDFESSVEIPLVRETDFCSYGERRAENEG